MENTMKVTGFVPAEILGKDDKIPVSERMRKYFEEKKQNREDKKFEKIKEKLFLKAINSDPELKQYYDDLKLFKKTSHIDNPTDKELLDEKRNVWRGAVATEKSDRRNLIFSTGSSVVTVLGAIGLSVTAAGLISVAGLALGCVPLLITMFKYKNRQKFNKADSSAKGRDYEKILVKFMGSVEKYKDTIDANKDIILDAKKNMSRADFKKFMGDFRDETLDILNIDSETFVEQEGKGEIPVKLEDQVEEPKLEDKNVADREM